MKEATGELNMTVITVVAIAAVAAFFYAFIWPSIKTNIQRNTYCATATCSSCTTKGSKQECSCTYFDENNTEQEIKCYFEDTDTKLKKQK